MSEYICKRATLREVQCREQYLIDIHLSDRQNWTVWAKERIGFFQEGKILLYYGLLNGRIICEATANLDRSVDRDSDGLIDTHRAYLSAFRTDKPYEGQGYFSKLYRFMESDLQSMGYDSLTLGVEPEQVRNCAIYRHYGFTDKVKSVPDVYPDGRVVMVDYYKKDLKLQKKQI